MFLEYTEDEQALEDAFAAVCAARCGAEVVRAAEPLGFSRGLWGDLCEMGAAGLGLPEAWGGSGADLAQIGIVVRLLGAHLAPVPLVEHVVASRLLASAVGGGVGGSEELVKFAEQISSGAVIATLALRPVELEGAAGAAGGGQTEARPQGVAKLLPAGAVAELILWLSTSTASASVSSSISPTSAPSSPASPEPILAATRSAAPFAAASNTASLPIADRRVVPSLRLASGDPAAQHYLRAVSEWKALTAMALCGLGQRALDLGVDYVLERQQFDRPIAGFQAVQHGLADAAVELEAAYYMCQRALWMLDAAQPDADTFAAMSFLFAAETAQRTTASVLHYHGGYGYAEEYDIGLYYRRAKGWSLIYDDPSSEYQRLANALL